MDDVFNFSAGPAVMPKAVLENAQQQLLNWQNSGMSVMEVSHRGASFMAMIKQIEQDFRSLYAIPDHYKILFLQGGARGQFAGIPMNLLSRKGKALYLTSGHWSKLAVEEARLFGEVDEITILEKEPNLKINMLDLSTIGEHYDYVHYCPNETISGVEMFTPPKIGKGVLVADMSSCILSRQIDISQFGVIYAGAQKNLGPSGITIVIVREDLLGYARKTTPSIWNYALQAKRDSMVNTPPTFAWYLCGLVFQYWIAQGGMKAIEQHNQAKAKCLYDYLDSSQLFHNNVAKENRSEMNVAFTTGNKNLDVSFIQFAESRGLYALKGHQVQGGMRASLYNAMPMAGVATLVEVMQDFESTHAPIVV